MESPLCFKVEQSCRWHTIAWQAIPCHGCVAYTDAFVNYAFWYNRVDPWKNSQANASLGTSPYKSGGRACRSFASSCNSFSLYVFRWQNCSYSYPISQNRNENAYIFVYSLLYICACVIVMVGRAKVLWKQLGDEFHDVVRSNMHRKMLG